MEIQAKRKQVKHLQNMTLHRTLTLKNSKHLKMHILLLLQVYTITLANESAGHCWGI